MGIKSLLQLLQPITKKIELTSLASSSHHASSQTQPFRLGVDMLCLMHTGFSSSNSVNNVLKKLQNSQTFSTLLTNPSTSFSQYAQFITNALTSEMIAYIARLLKLFTNQYHLACICVFDGLDIGPKRIENDARSSSRQSSLANLQHLFEAQTQNDSQQFTHFDGLLERNTVPPSFSNISINESNENNEKLHPVSPTAQPCPNISSALSSPNKLHYFIRSIAHSCEMDQEIIAKLIAALGSNPNLDTSNTDIAMDIHTTTDDPRNQSNMIGIESNQMQRSKCEFLIAPYQADSQLSYLNATSYIDAVYSEDSDMLVYGSKWLLTKLNLTTTPHTFQSIQIADILSCPYIIRSNRFLEQMQWKPQNPSFAAISTSNNVNTVSNQPNHSHNGNTKNTPFTYKPSNPQNPPTNPPNNINKSTTATKTAPLALPFRSFTKIDLIIFAIVLGCDFLPNLPKIGIATVLKEILLEQHRLSSLPHSSAQSNFVASGSIANQNASNTHHATKCVSTESNQHPSNTNKSTLLPQHHQPNPHSKQSQQINNSHNLQQHHRIFSWTNVINNLVSKYYTSPLQRPSQGKSAKSAKQSKWQTSVPLQQMLSRFASFYAIPWIITPSHAVAQAVSTEPAKNTTGLLGSQKQSRFDKTKQLQAFDKNPPTPTMPPTAVPVAIVSSKSKMASLYTRKLNSSTTSASTSSDNNTLPPHSSNCQSRPTNASESNTSTIPPSVRKQPIAATSTTTNVWKSTTAAASTPTVSSAPHSDRQPHQQTQSNLRRNEALAQTHSHSSPLSSLQSLYHTLVHRILITFLLETVYDPITHTLTSCSEINNIDFLVKLLHLAGFSSISLLKRVKYAWMQGEATKVVLEPTAISQTSTTSSKAVLLTVTWQIIHQFQHQQNQLHQLHQLHQYQSNSQPKLLPVMHAATDQHHHHHHQWDLQDMPLSIMEAAIDYETFSQAQLLQWLIGPPIPDYSPNIAWLQKQYLLSEEIQPQGQQQPRKTQTTVICLDIDEISHSSSNSPVSDDVTFVNISTSMNHHVNGNVANKSPTMIDVDENKMNDDCLVDTGSERDTLITEPLFTAYKKNNTTHTIDWFNITTASQDLIPPLEPFTQSSPNDNIDRSHQSQDQDEMLQHQTHNFDSNNVDTNHHLYSQPIEISLNADCSLNTLNSPSSSSLYICLSNSPLSSYDHSNLQQHLHGNSPCSGNTFNASSNFRDNSNKNKDLQNLQTAFTRTTNGNSLSNLSLSSFPSAKPPPLIFEIDCTPEMLENSPFFETIDSSGSDDDISETNLYNNTNNQQHKHTINRTRPQLQASMSDSDSELELEESDAQLSPYSLNKRYQHLHNKPTTAAATTITSLAHTINEIGNISDVPIKPQNKVDLHNQAAVVRDFSDPAVLSRRNDSIDQLDARTARTSSIFVPTVNPRSHQSKSHSSTKNSLLSQNQPKLSTTTIQATVTEPTSLKSVKPTNSSKETQLTNSPNSVKLTITAKQATLKQKLPPKPKPQDHSLVAFRQRILQQTSNVQSMQERVRNQLESQQLEKMGTNHVKSTSTINPSVIPKSSQSNKNNDNKPIAPNNNQSDSRNQKVHQRRSNPSKPQPQFVPQNANKPSNQAQTAIKCSKSHQNKQQHEVSSSTSLAFSPLAFTLNSSPALAIFTPQQIQFDNFFSPDNKQQQQQSISASTYDISTHIPDNKRFDNGWNSGFILPSTANQPSILQPKPTQSTHLVPHSRQSVSLDNYDLPLDNQSTSLIGFINNTSEQFGKLHKPLNFSSGLNISTMHNKDKDLSDMDSVSNSMSNRDGGLHHMDDFTTAFHGRTNHDSSYLQDKRNFNNKRVNQHTLWLFDQLNKTNNVIDATSFDPNDNEVEVDHGAEDRMCLGYNHDNRSRPHLDHQQQQQQSPNPKPYPTHNNKRQRISLDFNHGFVPPHNNPTVTISNAVQNNDLSLGLNYSMTTHSNSRFDIHAEQYNAHHSMHSPHLHLQQHQRHHKETRSSSSVQDVGFDSFFSPALLPPTRRQQHPPSTKFFTPFNARSTNQASSHQTQDYQSTTFQSFGYLRGAGGNPG